MSERRPPPSEESWQAAEEGLIREEQAVLLQGFEAKHRADHGSVQTHKDDDRKERENQDSLVYD